MMGDNSHLATYGLLLARMLASTLFLISGIEKILTFHATAAFMEASVVPAWLLPAVIGLELVCGIAVLIGYKMRWAAFLLAFFSILAAVIYHHEFSNKLHFILFWSDLAIAGGFLALVVAGPGRLSLDHYLERRR